MCILFVRTRTFVYIATVSLSKWENLQQYNTERIYRQSHFAVHPNNALYSNLLFWPNIQTSITNLFNVSPWSPLIWNSSLVFLCLSWHWHVFKESAQFSIVPCFLVIRFQLCVNFGRAVYIVLWVPPHPEDRWYYSVTLLVMGTLITWVSY